MVSQVGHAAELLKSELSSARLCTSQTPLNSLATHAVRHARQKGMEATDRDVHEAGLSAFGERVDVRTHRALREAGQLRRHHTKPAVRAAWCHGCCGTPPPPAAPRPATVHAVPVSATVSASGRRWTPTENNAPGLATTGSRRWRQSTPWCPARCSARRPSESRRAWSKRRRLQMKFSFAGLMSSW